MNARRLVTAFGAVCAIARASGAHAQTSPAITVVDLRARLAAFTHDSMMGRETSGPGHARATEYIVQELKRLGIPPVAAYKSYYQDVPLRTVTVSPGRLTTANDVMHVGVDFVPLPGATEIPFPRISRVYRRAFVYAGRLGDKNALHPSETKDKIVLFDAPLRENGQPDYQVWKYANTLALYREAHAILIATLDFTPRAVLDRFTGSWVELQDAWKPHPNIRPVALVSRATAAHLRLKRPIDGSPTLGGTLSFETTSEPMPLAPQNAIAIVNGRDAALAPTYVVVSAHTDHLGVVRDSLGRAGVASYNGANAGSGAVALLELAEYFAAHTDAPVRSIVFLWTAADEQGQLGEQFFAQNPTIDEGRIYAHIRLDHIARAPEGALVCGQTDSPFARRGIPSVTVAGPTIAADRRAGDIADRINAEQYAAATARIAEMIKRVAADSAGPANRADRARLLMGCKP